MATSGKLIVLEGVDGAGTTTHSKRLVSGLRERDQQAHLTQEPSNGPMGALLRQTLTGRMVMSGGDTGSRPPSWNTMALMFAADRLDHVETELTPNLEEGVSVICDRYYHSSVAYQSMTSGLGVGAIGWIKEINRYARRPDLTIVLGVPAQVAAERRERRRGSDIFDGAELQDALGTFYAELSQHFPDEHIAHVNADGPIDEVADRILELAIQKLDEPA